MLPENRPFHVFPPKHWIGEVCVCIIWFRMTLDRVLPFFLSFRSSMTDKMISWERRSYGLRSDVLVDALLDLTLRRPTVDYATTHSLTHDRAEAVKWLDCCC